MRLLADCGNTTVKLALADASGLHRAARVNPAAVHFTGFINGDDTHITSLDVLAVSLATSAPLLAWWREHGAGRPVRQAGKDLPIPDLGQYPGCGSDRVLAGLAASRGGPVVVVEVGTATTISAWGPQFAGGLILPGVRTCLAGLHFCAPALPLVEPLGPEALAAQHTTAGAMGAAVGIGYGPMVAACLLKLVRETGIRRALATGGDVELLVRSQVVPMSAVRPFLVLEGLAAIG